MDMMLEEFKTIFDRPEKVRKLRETILNLAVRGQLVPQIDEESSDNLIKTIFELKLKYHEEMENKKVKILTKADLKVPFNIPRGWNLICIGDLMELINGRTFKPSDWSEKGLPIIRIQNLNNKNSTFNYCDFDVDQKYYVNNGELLIGWSGTPGTSFGAFIWEQDKGVLNQHIFKAVPYTDINKEFLKIFINARLEEMIEKSHGGVGLKHITKGNFESMALPIPSSEEQERIVNKYNELIEICDKLEELLEKKVYCSSLSAKSVFNSIGNATTTEELEENLRFILSNFKDLSLGDDAVKELKNCILQLAVQGKLVPQDPLDEPAEVLLERIQEEKEKLIREKKIKREKPLPDISREEEPYELPIGWKWVYINEVAFVTKLAGFEYTKYLANSITNNGEVPIVRARNIKMNKFIDTIQEFISFDLSEKLNRSALYKKCILITFIGAGIGEVAIFDKANRYHLAPNIAKIEIFNNFYMNIDENYALYCLMSPIGQNDIFAFLKATAQPSLSMETIRKVRVPIPPLPEQKRIVEKVDSLMQLCDELEKKIEKSKNYSNRLMESILKSSF